MNSTELSQRIDIGLKKAVKKAILQHKRAGQAIHIWSDNKILEISPQDIKVDDNSSEPLA